MWISHTTSMSFQGNIKHTICVYSLFSVLFSLVKAYELRRRTWFMFSGLTQCKNVYKYNMLIKLNV